MIAYIQNCSLIALAKAPTAGVHLTAGGSRYWFRDRATALLWLEFPHYHLLQLR
jgi:hypothetical protein